MTPVEADATEVGPSSVDKRFPQRVFGHGSEPDPRFTLANERTFLAWIRTALAVVAGGIALTAFQLPMPGAIQHSAAIASLILGAVVAGSAWLAWMATERALRLRRPLPSGTLLALPLAAGIAVITVILIVGILV